MSYNKGMKKPYEIISFGENFTDDEKNQIMKELNYFYDDLNNKFYLNEVDEERDRFIEQEEEARSVYRSMYEF